MSNRDKIVEYLKQEFDNEYLGKIFEIIKECEKYNIKKLDEIKYIIKHPEEYNTLEFWQKDYINSLMVCYDNEELHKLSDKEYKKVENKVYDLVCKGKFADRICDCIDNYIFEAIGIVLKEGV